MEDKEFRKLVKEGIEAGRKEAKKKVLSEYGDEFGDIDLGDFSDFKKVFMGPFTDTLKLIKGSISKISSKAWGVIEVITKGIPALVVPFLSVEYKNIFDKERLRQADIEQKYKDVFDKAKNLWNTEAGKIAFMLNPYIFAAGRLTKLSANETLDLADVLSGNSPDITSKTSSIRNTIGIGESVSLLSCLLKEDSETEEAYRLFKDENTKNRIQSSSKVRELISDARAMKNETLNSIKKMAETFSRIQTPEDFEKIVGKKLDLTRLRDMKKEDRDAAIRSIIITEKVSLLGSVQEQLELQINELNQIDISESSDLRKVYERVLNDVNKMIEKVFS